ncbi:MAG: aldo/keto reductase [Planctomycetota bacterium]|nr:aldo/keto reductase [Planctomycetota bacterium]
MRTRLLGKTGLRVGEMGFGTCFMADAGQEGVNRAVARAVDLGVNYFDTAADYGKGRDESMLGEALRGRRERVVLATKVGYTPDPRGHRSATALMEQFEGSLQRLGVDHVDIIQVHEGDYRKWWIDTDEGPKGGLDHTGETMRDGEAYDFAGAPVVEFLESARRSGKARFVGLTAKNARLQAELVRELRLDAVMTAHQFNPIYRNAAQFLFPVTQEQGTGVVLGAALMKGWLARPETTWRAQPPAWSDAVFMRAYEAYLAIHARSGMSMAELSIRWLLGENRQHSIVVGCSNVGEVELNAASIAAGPLPEALHAEIAAIGIVHPLIYQGRSAV